MATIFSSGFRNVTSDDGWGEHHPPELTPEARDILKRVETVVDDMPHAYIVRPDLSRLTDSEREYIAQFSPAWFWFGKL